MTTKAARRRNKRKWRAATKEAHTEPQGQKGPEVAKKPKETAQPTPERLKMGIWRKPKGGGRGMIDEAHDMIGRLGAEGKLTSQQVESARAFQERRALYVAELEVPGFKSCLAGGSGGYDGTDGNTEVVLAYNAMRDRIGRIATACLVLECGKLTHERPGSLDALRNALNVLGSG